MKSFYNQTATNIITTLLKGKKRAMSPEMISSIHDLYKKETQKVSSVKRHINAARDEQGLFINEPTPSKAQLDYLLKKYKLGDTSKMIKLGDLMKWCEDHSNFTSNGDQSFVASYETFTGIKKGFRFCISTPNLLRKLLKMKILAIDATYKLNWMGFQTLIVRTTH